MGEAGVRSSPAALGADFDQAAAANVSAVV